MMQISACYDLDNIIIYDFIYCSSHVHLDYTPGRGVGSSLWVGGGLKVEAND